MRTVLWLAAGSSVFGCAEPSAPVAVAGAGSAGAPAAVAQSSPGLRLPEGVRPTHYRLELRIDPDAGTLAGAVQIDVEIDRPRSEIWIHAEGLDVTRARAAVADPAKGPTWFPLSAQPQAEHGLLRLGAQELLPSGGLELHLDFNRRLEEGLDGVYRVEAGDRWYAFTQFEPLSARKAFPCFDEPRFKAPFDVTLTVPKDVEGVGNTRVVSREVGSDGQQHLRLATTPPLPTYLMAWAVGPLDVVEAPPIPPNGIRRRPVPLRGVAVRGKGEQLAYALRETPEILEAAERYFGTEYAFDKLDLIAVPDFEAGAMENVGAVTFREYLLLMGEDAPAQQRQAFQYVAAHELAHMWFGNLTTMHWWDDLWLNEAFASWMEHRITDARYPEYRAPVALAEWVHESMNADSLASARRIREPVDSEHGVYNAFDSITYGKGGGVLGMFERWLGEETFQRGVRRYLADHRFSNASAQDLVAALAEASGRDVAGPFETFLTQPGVPFVEARLRCDDEGAELALAQSRSLPVGSKADRAGRWQIPVCVRYESAGGARERCEVLTGASGVMRLDGSDCPAWIMPNAAGAGYYRWSLPAEQMTALMNARGELSDAERLSVADSLGAALDGDRLPAADALRAISTMADDTSRAVAETPMVMMRRVRSSLLQPSDVPEFERLAAGLYAAQLKRLGWTARPGDDDETRSLRAEVVDFMAVSARDPKTRREAIERGVAHLGFGKGGVIDPEAVDPDVAETAMVVMAEEGGPEAYELMVQHLKTSEDARFRQSLLRALAGFADPALRARSLDLLLGEHVRKGEVYRALDAHFRRPEARDAAWRWLRTHWNALAARLPEAYVAYLPGPAASFCSPSRADELAAFFGPRVGQLPGGPRNVAAVVELVRLCAARRAAQSESARAYFGRPATGG